jgi:uncharacterized membrane protein YsdA (DUF1294 family)/cold shock CspA family protein
MRFDGEVKIWNDERGFGFIQPLSGGQEIFVHVKAFLSRSVRPEVGQRVSFEIETGSDGRKRAKRVELVRAKRQLARAGDDNPAQWGTASLFAIPGLFVLFGVCSILWKLPAWVALVYLVASAVCFTLYAVDKSAAAAKRWRVSEATLLWVGLVGGWPGAILAQQYLRHKSNKVSFRAKFWITVTVNVLGLLILSSPLRDVLWARFLP